MNPKRALDIVSTAKKTSGKNPLEIIKENPALGGGCFIGGGGCSTILILSMILGMVYFASGGEDAAFADPGDIATTACGTGVSTLIEGYDMLPQLKGKLGHEQHLNTVGLHHCDALSKTAAGGCTQIGNGSFYPRDTRQERFYFNTLWGGWDWTPTRDKRAPIAKTGEMDKEARSTIPHSKLIVTSNETGKSIVVSAEESGPALWVAERDGIWYGAPPEVYAQIGASNPYTGDPNDGRGEVTVRFAQDQSIKLGPCL